MPKDQRIPDHYRIESVQFTEFDLIGTPETRFYERIKDHLEQKKLSRAEDYRGCILVCYFSLRGKMIGIRELRAAMRTVKQDAIEQIWVIVPESTKYGFAELLSSDDPFVVIDLAGV